jgi:hypothetical protein
LIIIAIQPKNKQVPRLKIMPRCCQSAQASDYAFFPATRENNFYLVSICSFLNWIAIKSLTLFEMVLFLRNTAFILKNFEKIYGLDKKVML